MLENYVGILHHLKAGFGIQLKTKTIASTSLTKGNILWPRLINNDKN